MSDRKPSQIDPAIEAELDALIPQPIKSVSTFAEEQPSHNGHRRRMRKKFWETGEDKMTDLDLLEMVLYYANVRKDTRPLSERVIKKFGTVENVLFADVSELNSVLEVGESVYTLLVLIRLLMERFRAPINDQKNFNDEAFLEPYLVSQFRGFDKERLMVYALDSRGRLISKMMKMSVDFGMVRFSYEEIFDFLRKNEAVAVILAHNHPNGIAVASPADVESTRKLCSYLNENGILLVEHYVVAGEQVSPIIRKCGENSFRKQSFRDYYQEPLKLL